MWRTNFCWICRGLNFFTSRKKCVGKEGKNILWQQILQYCRSKPLQFGSDFPFLCGYGSGSGAYFILVLLRSYVMGSPHLHDVSVMIFSTRQLGKIASGDCFLFLLGQIRIYESVLCIPEPTKCCGSGSTPLQYGISSPLCRKSRLPRFGPWTLQLKGLWAPDLPRKVNYKPIRILRNPSVFISYNGSVS